MEFDPVYNLHCSLRLHCGRIVILDKLIQSRTYSGLLLGTPDKESNDEKIRTLLDKTRNERFCEAEPYLIEPERRDYCRQVGDMQFTLEQQKDRPIECRRIPEWLPFVECIGLFHSLAARDQTKDGSALTIVWFQKDFGFDEKAIEDLRSVDWDRYAVDFEY